MNIRDILFRTVFTIFLAVFATEKIHAQPALVAVNLSHTQGEWETLQPLKLGNVELFGIKLNSDGTMVAKVAVGGMRSNASFNYKINLSDFTIQANEAIGEIASGTSFRFHLRKRFDGGIELEDQSAMQIINQSGILTAQINNAAVFSKISSSNNAPSAIDELAAIEKDLQKKNLYSGSGVTSNQALQSARTRASGVSSSCPQGYKIRKSEDVRSYLINQEELQLEISKSIEKFTNKALTKSDSIKKFNELTSQSNQITQWGWGKVTNGTCGPVEITKLISKSVETTKNLFNDFRLILERN